MPTAGGESIYGVEGIYPYIKAEAVDIVMPDVKVCGGLLEVKKIAALAEGAGLLVSPHGPASPVGNAAAAQVSATIPSFNILELAYGEKHIFGIRHTNSFGAPGIDTSNARCARSGRRPEVLQHVLETRHDNPPECSDS